MSSSLSCPAPALFYGDAPSLGLSCLLDVGLFRLAGRLGGLLKPIDDGAELTVGEHLVVQPEAPFNRLAKRMRPMDDVDTIGFSGDGELGSLGDEDDERMGFLADGELEVAGESLGVAFSLLDGGVALDGLCGWLHSHAPIVEADGSAYGAASPCLALDGEEALVRDQEHVDFSCASVAAGDVEVAHQARAQDSSKCRSRCVLASLSDGFSLAFLQWFSSFPFKMKRAPVSMQTGALGTLQNANAV